MPTSHILRPQDVCVLAERDEFDDMMSELMDGAAGATCILTDKYETRVNGEVVCTSHSHRVNERLVRLANIETNPDLRSRGVGTAHMKRLLAAIAEENPAAVALFFEIESRREEGLSADASAIRARRGLFYERLGAIARDGVVLVPRSFCGAAVPGAGLAQMELMWIPLRGTPTAADIDSALRYVLIDVGSVDPDHPLVGQVMTQQFPNGIPTEYADWE